METTSFKENSGNCEMPRKSAADLDKSLQEFDIEYSDKKLPSNKYTLQQRCEIRKSALKNLLAEYNQPYTIEKLEIIYKYLKDCRVSDTNDYSISKNIKSFLKYLWSIYAAAILGWLFVEHPSIDTLTITIKITGLGIMIISIISMWKLIFPSNNKRQHQVTLDLLRALIWYEDWDRVKQEASQDCNTEPDNE